MDYQRIANKLYNILIKPVENQLILEKELLLFLMKS